MSRIVSIASRAAFAAFLSTTVAGPALAAAASESTLHNFAGQAGGDGNRPSASLIVGTDGYLYGTTAQGGNQGSGEIFKISPTVTDGSISQLYAFSAGSSGSDGGTPLSGLILASDGNYYGTTRGGGSTAANNSGTVYQLNTSSGGRSFSNIHVFQATATDGSHPVAGLVQVGSMLYGTTSDGGGKFMGTVFSISLANTSQFTTLHNFQGGGSGEGAYPMGGLIGGADGNLYGTTFAGGSNNCGTIYQLSPGNGAFKTLYSFTCGNGSGQDLGFPMGSLVQGLDGTLYGTTTAYGLRASGSIFSIKPDGTGFTTLYTFVGADNGVSPQSGLVLGTDGNLYGTTPAVGMDNNANGSTNGTVFSFNPHTKVLTTQWGFTTAPGGLNGDGWNSLGGLVQGPDGNFYGTAANGGANNNGTVYKITPATSLPPPISISLSQSSALLGDQVTLTWALASNINTGGSASQCFASGNDTNWAGLQATSGSKVFTYNKLGTYTYALTCGGSNTASVSITVSAVPAPTGLTAVAGDGQVTLSWTAVTGAATYNVYEGVNGVPTGGPIQTGLTATTATISGLNDGTTYYFKVSAVSAAGQEGPKSSAVAAVPTATATQPQDLVATPKNGAVLLTWTAASGANSYNVYQSTTSGGEGTTPIASGIAASSAPSYLVTGLTNGTTYYFQVASVNRSQTSALSQEKSATPQPPPDAPTGVSATAGDGTATVSWTAVSGATSYDIYETPAQGSLVKIGSVNAPATSFKVNGLANGKVYAFNVVAVNSSGSSAPSATVTATPQAPASGSGGAVAPEALALMALAALRRRRKPAAT